jgi:hypothetical protein
MHGRLAIAMAVFLALGCGGSGGGGGAGSGGNAGSGGGAQGGSSAGGSAGDSSGGGGSAGTGTGGAVAPPAGVDGTKSIANATAADQMATCDWFANLAGGYGASSTCPSGVLQAPETQAACLMTFPTCDVTFADFEACVVAVVHGQQACTSTSVRDAQSSDACTSVIPAGCF